MCASAFLPSLSILITLNLIAGIPAHAAESGKNLAGAERGFHLEEDRPSAAQTLVSGVPAAFSLPAVSQGTLFIGDFGFIINVPQGATRLEISITTTTANADVDLFARYGGDPGVSGGQVVADHRSTSASGSERIEVDLAGWNGHDNSGIYQRYTSPVLRAGNYHIALGVLSTGVAVNGTVVATVTGGSPGPGPGTGLAVFINQVIQTNCSTPKIIASVTNNGLAVTGLTVANFVLKEDTQVRTITVTDVSGGTTGPLSMAIVIDTSTSLSETDLQNEKAAAVELVNRLPATANIAIYAFGSTVSQVQGFTTNKTVLAQAINSIVRGGSTALYRAIDTAAKALLTQSGRKAIVLLTDGEDTVGGVTLQEAINSALAAGAPVFTIGFGAANHTILGQIARDTGAFHSQSATSTDLTLITQSISQVISSQYEITYTTSSITISHTIELTVTVGVQTVTTTRTVGVCTGGTACPVTVTKMEIRGGTFSGGVFSGGSVGTVWDTDPLTGAWVMGVSDTSGPIAPFLNRSDGSVNIPAGNYYLYLQPHPSAYGTAAQVSVTWSDGRTDVAVFQVGAQFTSANWTRLSGSTNIALARVFITDIDRVRGDNAANGLRGDGSPDDIFEITLTCPGGPSGGPTVIINQVIPTACPSTTLVVSVTDSFGAAITGLTVSNFVLREDNEIRTITVRSATATALTMAIVIDTSTSLSATDLDNEKLAAIELVNRLPATANIAIYSFGTTVAQVQNFTTNKTALVQAINSIARGGSTALYRAIDTAAKALLAQTGRKAIVLLTDGEDTVGGVTLQEAINSARAAGAPVFTIGFGAANHTILGQIARDTGGFHSQSATSADLTRIAQSISQVLVNQYEITYVTSSVTISHTIELTVTIGAQRTVVTHVVAAGCGGGGTGVGGPTVIINQVIPTACPSTTLVVSVTDSFGAAITGLTVSNFVLREDNEIRTITVRGATATALTMAIVIDTSTSLSATDLDNEKLAAIELVNRLPATANIAIYSFGTTVAQVQNFTTNKTALVQAINSIARGGSTALYRAIDTAAKALLAQTGRKAIVLLTDGEDTVGGVTLQEAINSARAAGAPVFTIGFGAANHTILGQIARDTGGFHSQSATSADLTRIAQSISQVLVNQYEITYVTSSVTISHTIELTVTIGAQRTVVTQVVAACGGGGGTTQPGCNYFVQPLEYSFSAAGGTAGGSNPAPGGTVNPPVLITTQTQCRWGVIVNNPSWITLEAPAGASSTGSGAASYRVAANSGPARTGSLIIAGTNHTVRQAGGSACAYSLSSTTSVLHRGSGDYGSVNVTAVSGTDCRWSASVTSGNTWISIISGRGGLGNGRVEYAVGANAGAQRTGTILIAGITFTVVQAAAGTTGDPLVPTNGVVPAATGIPPSLPGGALALGSFFSVFGIDIGPEPQVQVTAFPLPTVLGGSSVTLRQGSISVDTYLVFASRTQINGIIPSFAPTGDVDLIVTYNGRSSAPVRIRIVRHNFGIFATAAGRGPGIITNFNSQTDQPLNTRSASARLRQYITIWGTGAGPIGASDAQAPPVVNLPYGIDVYIGGRRQTNIYYAGRSSCCAGLDQIVVEITDAPYGCSVPVQVRVESSWSNVVTMAISPDGSRCSDPQNPLSSAPVTGAKVGALFLIRGEGLIPPDTGMAPQNFRADLGAAYFVEVPAGGDLGFNPFTSLPPAGSCQSYSENVDASALFTGNLPLFSAIESLTKLDAGTEMTVTNPSGRSVTIPRTTSGSYLQLLGGSIPLPGSSQSSAFLDGGAYRIQGRGGSQVGAFDASVTLPSPVIWTNRDQITVIDRSQGVRFDWSGGTSTQMVLLLGMGTNQTTKALNTFFCLVPGNAGSFTVPPSALYNLPVTGAPDLAQSVGALMLGVLPTANFATFAASGIDMGLVIPASLDFRTVEIR